MKSNHHLRLGTAVVFGAALMLAACRPAFAQDQDKRLKDNYELMRMFAETFEQIDQNYVKDIDRRELMEAAIHGMLMRLDRYSSYIPRQQMEQFNQVVEQEYGGVGLQVNVVNGWLTVVTPLPGGPAYFKGVHSGDVIAEINGESTEGLNVDECIAKMKGPRGGEVRLGLRRAGASPEDPVETVTLVREIIQVATVRGDTYKDGNWNFMLDPETKIGYLRLTHFSRRSALEMSQALESLRSNGMKGLVLDLRDNPGGLLSQATAIADLFVEDGLIVRAKGRNVKEQKWMAHRGGTFSDFPMAVLVNRISASASEIVSACLQDHKRAVIVGERSWGKGSVQNVINLESGKSALKLTTASYFRPSGRNIHRFPEATDKDEWGVSPDEGFGVRFTPRERRNWRINRRARDIIREGKQADVEPPVEFVDRQLEKALEYIRTEIKKEQTAAPTGKNG